MGNSEIRSSTCDRPGPLPLHVQAWNGPTHMISGEITYQYLRRENSTAITGVSALSEKHPWYNERWRRQIEQHSEATEILFMLAARWADDVRRRDGANDRPQWALHQLSVQARGRAGGDQTASAGEYPNRVRRESAILRSEVPAEQRAIALAWLFYLVGDIHQPLHTAQIFTRQ